MTTGPSPSTTSLFGPYQAGAAVFDELRTPTGAQRAHWSPFTNLIDGLGRRGLERRRETARRIIRDHGVTYNVYGDPEGTDRPWDFDMIPLLIPAADWRWVEMALIQRTRLLNLILADLYGPQRLIREGALPAALVQANPGFLRPCHGLPVPQGIHLHVHAVDLARAPNGRWWVLADRTQAPSGAGYALENRIVASRSMEDILRASHVRRLAPFFYAQRETLARLALTNRDNPRIVLLTPGPLNETFFEHAYLSRYLGFDLVEGADLTVRGDRVFVKTLAGLRPVDVILRRVDDVFCDPLELRSDSFLGVAGLVQAARAGNVVIANALGSGLIETAAIMAFLPSLCQRLLGEELLISSVATWWCGQPQERRYVLDHLDQLVVKPTFPSKGRDPVFPSRLDREQRAAFAAAIEAQPQEYVGQERVDLSTTPSWTGRELQPRAVVLRAFVTATGDSYAVMAGGLTRVASDQQTPVVSMQSGGGSKDTWILADGPISSLSLLTPEHQPAELVRAPSDLPSRAADSLFWVGRYTERAEQTTRLLRTVVARMLSESGTEQAAELDGLARMLWSLNLFQHRYDAQSPRSELEREILATILKQQRAGSLRDTLTRLRRVALAVRNQLSVDTWRILTLPHQELVHTNPRRLPIADVLALLDRLIVDWAAFSGMETENMIRGDAWRFLDLGRRVERALGLLGLLRTALWFAPPNGGEFLAPLLETADTSMTYRRRYFTNLQLAPVIDLLIADDTNPRAVAFQLHAITAHLEHLPHAPLERARHLVGLVAGADIKALCREREQGLPAALDALLETMQTELQQLTETMIEVYFSHARPSVSAT